MAGLIQRHDVKTEAELVSAGADKTSLIQDNQIYVAHAEVTETLDDAIETNKLHTFKEISTPANPSANYRKLYPKSDGKFYHLGNDGIETQLGGSGAAGINYISNWDAETNTTGWATYADVAGESPVDGTGGTANITWTRSTSTPIYGTASFLFTKDAANRQGEGVSYDFNTVGLKFISNRIRFFVETDSNYVDESLSIWIYAKDSAGLIQPTGEYKLKKRTGVKRIALEYVGLSTDDDYRLIIHCNSTTATAYTVKFDIVEVGPSDLLFETEKAKQYNLTVTGNNSWSTSSAKGTPYKVYDESGNEKWRLAFNIYGTFSSVTSETITLSGITFASTYQAVAAFSAASAADCYSSFTLSSTSNISLAFDAVTTAAVISGDVELESKPTFVVDDFEVVRSSDEGVIVVDAYKSSVSTGVSGPNDVIFNTERKDNGGMYDNSTGIFTVIEQGEYDISGLVSLYGFSTTTEAYGALYENIGAGFSEAKRLWRDDVTTAYDTQQSFSVKRYYNSGTSFKIVVTSDSGTYNINSGENYTYINVCKISSNNNLIVGEAALGYLPNYQYLNGASFPTTTNLYGWHFNETSFSNGGTWIGSKNFTVNAGSVGLATNHLGQSTRCALTASDSIQIQDTVFDTANESISVGAWFYVDPTCSGYLFKKSSSFYVYQTSANRIECAVYGGSTVTMNVDIGVMQGGNNWKFIEFIYNQSSTSMTLLVDGKIVGHKVDANLSTRTGNTNYFTIGDSSLVGRVSEVFYHKANVHTFDQYRKLYVTGTKKKAYIDENSKCLILGETGSLSAAQIATTGNLSTTSTSYVDVSDMILYILSPGALFQIDFTCAMSLTNYEYCILNLDGSDIASTERTSASNLNSVAINYQTYLTEGSHTIKIRYKSGTGTTEYMINRVLNYKMI